MGCNAEEEEDSHSFASEATAYFSMYTEASYSKDNKNKSKLHLFMLTTAQRNL
jgi:hypothetical protein